MSTIYDEAKIKTLSSLEHIRLRPGMYVGRISNGTHPDDGIFILLKEGIDNAVDEFIMGVGKDGAVLGNAVSVQIAKAISYHRATRMSCPWRQEISAVGNEIKIAGDDGKTK